MLPHSRSSISSLALKTLTSAVAGAVFLSSSAYAAGLGKLTVLSALGQPLRAEIELTAVSSEEANSLVAKLATTDAFKAANIDFNPALMSLRFAVEQRGGRQVIRITSAQPVNEPFVDMLLELSWNNGRLVREYTFLLDPPEMRSSQPAQVAPVVTAQPSRATPAPSASSNATPAAQAQTPTRAQPERPAGSENYRPAPKQGGTEYKVKAGDTLGRIAREVKPVNISLDMMLAALYQANPDAFNGSNMNRLKSGRILTVPDAESIKGTSEGDAHSMVVAHAADFTSYRNKLAGQVASAAPAKGQEASQNAAGKITAKVEERATAASEAQDQLKLSRATGAAAAKGASKGAGVSAEDTVAKNRALADAAARVKELEKNVSDLQKLVEVKSKGAADKVAADKAAADKAAADKLAADKAAADKLAADKLAADKATADKAKAEPAASAPVAETVASAPVAPKPVKPARKIAPPPPPPPEPGLIDMLLDNMTYIGAGLAVALLAAFGLSRRKPKPVASPLTEPSIQGANTDQAPSLFAQTGGQSVDTNNSVFNSSFAPSASQLDTNEVDPVAEADVYIAYGRDAQAEEILKEALRIHPERYPVRLKLLEIYAARKDLRAYETQAGEMYGLTKGQGDEWAQAAALGLTIDPANPLYAGGAGAVLADTAAGQAPDSDLLDLDLNLAASEPTAVPVAPVVEAAPAEDHTLDFDLGGLSFEPVTSESISASTAVPTAELVSDPNDMTFVSTVATPVPAPVAEEPSFDMAFDMSFDTPDAAAPAAAPAPLASSLDDISLDLSSNDLSGEFDMDDLAKSFELPGASPALAPSAIDNGLEFGSMDFDLPASAAPAPAAAAPALLLDADDPFALPDDLSTSVATPVETSAQTSAETNAETNAEKHAPNYAAANYAGESYVAAAPFDMSSIDLDLPGEPAAAAPAAPAGHTEEGSAAHMEMETKLDLAIAYQEIGDKEGARELLDEVIKGGSGSQVSKANEMRAKLA
ncbi:MAG: FimV/HubP family polar landmark protein [Massilia sp.]